MLRNAVIGRGNDGGRLGRRDLGAQTGARAYSSGFYALGDEPNRQHGLQPPLHERRPLKDSPCDPGGHWSRMGTIGPAQQISPFSLRALSRT